MRPIARIVTGCLLSCGWLAPLAPVLAQAVPHPGENIPYLVTFGANGDPGWGDDDHCQTQFFLIPKNTKGAVYVRVYDPGTGGALDEKKGAWDTSTQFSVYGGPGTHSTADARAINPRGEYRAGNLLAQEVYEPAAKGNVEEHDKEWVSFGPFDPKQGEYVSDFGGYVFKVLVEGKTGDDGNLYSFFLSSSPTDNIPIEGGNGFTYEYTFRLPSQPSAKIHLYPFIDKNVISIKQSNFDGDADGRLQLFSVARNGQPAQLSGDAQWASSQHVIDPREKGLSLDLAYTKKGASPNDVVFYVTDQYDKALPFFAIPLGGKPKYRYTVDIRFK